MTSTTFDESTTFKKVFFFLNLRFYNFDILLTLFFCLHTAHYNWKLPTKTRLHWPITAHPHWPITAHIFRSPSIPHHNCCILATAHLPSKKVTHFRSICILIIFSIMWTWPSMLFQIQPNETKLKCFIEIHNSNKLLLFHFNFSHKQVLVSSIQWGHLLTTEYTSFFIYKYLSRKFYVIWL